jgi:hypothetical protein
MVPRNPPCPDPANHSTTTLAGSVRSLPRHSHMTMIQNDTSEPKKAWPWPLLVDWLVIASVVAAVWIGICKVMQLISES